MYICTNVIVIKGQDERGNGVRVRKGEEGNGKIEEEGVGWRRIL